ncbi:MAG TPA: hypothetical protein VFW10_14110 [Steroidobacteraceae bacterium]|nr:hypothetical protein [Steroidobacteraceae bacterium]
MKQTTPYFLLLALALTVTPAAGVHAQSRPAGTSNSAWIPVTSDLGFVIEQTRVQPGPPAAFGYFVARRDAHWLRLDSIPNAALFRGPESSATLRAGWVPITDNLRFVIERRGGNDHLESVLGQFEARRGGHWLRLNLIPHGALSGRLETATGSEMPLGKHLLFVIEQPASDQGIAQIPSARGYFVARQGNHQLRLDSLPEGTLFRMPL